MEIVKQNETFKITDTTTSSWDVSGTFSKSTENAYEMTLSIQKGLESVAFVTYSNNSGQISLNYNCSETNRDSVATYIDTVIDAVLAYKTV